MTVSPALRTRMALRLLHRYAAQDLHFDRASEHVERGEWSEALTTIDAAPRLALLAEWRVSGVLDEAEFRDLWPAIWSGAEPDDTDPDWLAVWRIAAADGRVETAPLPAGDPLTIYRGQAEEPVGPPAGIAWTLERRAAVSEALGESVADDRRGHLIRATVARRHVIGYVTAGHESEVIVDPAHVVVVAVDTVTEADR